MDIKTKKKNKFNVSIIKKNKPTKKRNYILKILKLQKDKDELIELIRTYNIKEETLEAIKKIPRELFVPYKLINETYINKPLPIPCDQTISQPSLICSMIDSLELQPTDKVLEIGTGLGYNASIISLLCLDITTIEIYRALYKCAKVINKKLRKHTILNKNIKFVHKNGYKGYQKKAPYNKIIVTCGLEDPEIPIDLIEQLIEKGILLIPRKNYNNYIGERLHKYRKINGILEEDPNYNKLDVRFVKYENPI